jgi:ATP-binding protein involved in chromosome partitioning
MMSDDEITKQAFIDFAANAARGISMRNAQLPPTEVTEVLVASGA